MASTRLSHVGSAAGCQHERAGRERTRRRIPESPPTRQVVAEDEEPDASGEIGDDDHHLTLSRQTSRGSLGLGGCLTRLKVMDRITSKDAGRGGGSQTAGMWPTSTRAGQNVTEVTSKPGLRGDSGRD
jgi:hypothetical protein